MGEDTAARHIIRGPVRCPIIFRSRAMIPAARDLRRLTKQKGTTHRRTSRAAITVVHMVINVQQYVRHGPCVPVRGNDRLLPLVDYHT